MKHNITSIIFLTVLIVGCSKTPSLESGEHDISFSVQLSEGTKAAGAAGQFTATDLSSLDQFKVTGYDGTTKTIDARTVYKTTKSSVWQFIDNPKAWIAGHTMTFWADANMPSWASASSSSSSSASLSVTEIPSAAADQWDPLIGYYCGTGNNGNAPLKFYHPLTAITFKTGDKGDPAVISSINSVQLSGVLQNGTATISGGTPISISWSASNTKSVSVAFTGEQSAMPLLLIPQNLAAGNITMNISVTMTDSSTKTMHATITTGEWLPGYHYTYTIDYAPSIEMENTLKVTLTDWIYVNSTSGKHYFDADFDE